MIKVIAKEKKKRKKNNLLLYSAGVTYVHYYISQGCHEIQPFHLSG